MDWLGNALFIVVFVGVIVGVLINFQRHLAHPGGRKGTGAAAGLLSVESRFAPSSYEARIDLERQGQLQAPAPVPGDPMDGLHMAVNDDGIPYRVVISPNNP
ncbi:hypothetical protein [Arthrobacter psychrolactophilus]|nr:hypothetical protein [Arthrobacter psychrolactophilus]